MAPLQSLTIAALCLAGVLALALRAAAHDARSGLRYWQPWRVMVMGGVAAVVALYAVIVLSVLVLERA